MGGGGAGDWRAQGKSPGQRTFRRPARANDTGESNEIPAVRTTWQAKYDTGGSQSNQERPESPRKRPLKKETRCQPDDTDQTTRCPDDAGNEQQFVVPTVPRPRIRQRARIRDGPPQEQVVVATRSTATRGSAETASEETIACQTTAARPARASRRPPWALNAARCSTRRTTLAGLETRQSGQRRNPALHPWVREQSLQESGQRVLDEELLCDGKVRGDKRVDLGQQRLYRVRVVRGDIPLPVSALSTLTPRSRLIASSILRGVGRGLPCIRNRTSSSTSGATKPNAVILKSVHRTRTPDQHAVLPNPRRQVTAEPTLFVPFRTFDTRISASPAHVTLVTSPRKICLENSTDWASW